MNELSPGHEINSVMPESAPNELCLTILDSDEITEADTRIWKKAGLVFLEDLSKESFQLRFGANKPDDNKKLVEITDYFAGENTKYHQMLMLTNGDTIVGAASLFIFNTGIFEETTGIAEVSITVRDDMHRLGIGSALLEQAAIQASNEGYTHLYTSFTPDNDPSRRLCTNVLGRVNTVAGKRNLQDKFWRLPGGIPDLNSDKETLMREYCGDAPIEEYAEEVKSNTLGRAVAKRLFMLLPQQTGQRSHPSLGLKRRP